MCLDPRCRPEGRRYKGVSRTGCQTDSSARPKRSLFQSALQAAEKASRVVGRAFRHGIKSAFRSGVLTPEGPKGHFPATCLAAEVEFGCGYAAL